MRNFARRLMAHETGGSESSETKNPADFPVFEKLHPRLATLMGNAGFRALVSRSLALANEEFRWLRAVHVRSDGALEGLEGLHAQLAPEVFFEGKAVLLAQLLGLMVAFIGEKLTVRLVGEVWPKLSLNDGDFGKGDKSEKTK
jgi:hypothetical protein